PVDGAPVAENGETRESGRRRRRRGGRGNGEGRVEEGTLVDGSTVPAEDAAPAATDAAPTVDEASAPEGVFPEAHEREGEPSAANAAKARPSRPKA
ncbi:hypothetical protein, partial [Rubrivivax gelatinosus]|uniref:hypothetical protein n=1 Tax=Rubrivivax gelatinosus TaxID=28068 RepID=UPI0005C1D320